ncbi:hypothetical protein U1763_04245 [Sphingomonas sp. LB2R24]|uniref:hypothetical protein n=1 Tax=Sphingomonas sorbitolis TaxID=3096165 RepID=UPI002FC5A1FC
MIVAAPIIRPFVGAYYVGSPLTLLMSAGGGLTLRGVARVVIRGAQSGVGLAERREGKLA